MNLTTGTGTISTINIKGILDEDFQDYKKPCMLIATSKCDWKCCKEAGIPITVCQNEPLAQQETVEMPILELFHRYMGNPISKAIMFGGLEPMLQFNEILSVIDTFRSGGCTDEFVIFTGYNPDEVPKEIKLLKQRENIIVKFGRYVPNSKSRYDDILGVTLASENQYAEKIS